MPSFALQCDSHHDYDYRNVSVFFKVITFLVLVHRAGQAMGAYPLIVELCDFCDTENMDGNTESSHKKMELTV